jgi:hypothetical protein
MGKVALKDTMARTEGLVGLTISRKRTFLGFHPFDLGQASGSPGELEPLEQLLPLGSLLGMESE